MTWHRSAPTAPAYNPLHEEDSGSAAGAQEAVPAQQGNEKDSIVLGTENVGIAGKAERGHPTLVHEASESTGAVETKKRLIRDAIASLEAESENHFLQAMLSRFGETGPSRETRQFLERLFGQPITAQLIADSCRKWSQEPFATLLPRFDSPYRALPIQVAERDLLELLQPLVPNQPLTKLQSVPQSTKCGPSNSLPSRE